MIAAGGTGGHVYPALSIAQALKKQHPEAEFTFVGSVGGFERPLIAASDVPFVAVDEVRAGPLAGVSLPRKAWSMIQLVIGLVQAVIIMVRRRPRALLMTGGWVSFPTGVAAWLLRVPSLIYLPDIEPGLTIRALRHFTTRVAITSDESAQYFRPGHTVVTGYPLRESLVEAWRRGDRQSARAHFQLDPEKTTLLVFGGSRGARSINGALLDAAPSLIENGVQILHITGKLDWDSLQPAIHALDAAHYRAFPYLHEDMALAMCAADLVVSRGGASVLGEFPLFGLPAVIVPYPYAWRYQRVNAAFLEARGAAVMLRDEALAEAMLPTLRSLISDSERLAAMRAQMRTLARPDAADRGAAVFAELAGKGTSSV